MTSSHVRYYFDDLAEIAAWTLQQMCERHRAGMRAVLDSAPGNPAAALTHAFFSPRLLRRGGLSIFIELRGLATHSSAMQQTLAAHETQMLALVAELLRPVVAGREAEVANAAYALAQGLYIGEALGRYRANEARGLFAQTLAALVRTSDTAVADVA